MNETIHLTTIQPRPYSLGYELESSLETKKIEGKRFLFSLDVKCTREVLLDIIQSEDFRRGLLFIVKCSKDALEDIAENIANGLNKRESPVFYGDCKIYYLENDGNNLYNTELRVEVINEL